MRVRRVLVLLFVTSVLAASSAPPAAAGVMSSAFANTVNLSPGIDVTDVVTPVPQSYALSGTWVAVGDITGPMACSGSGIGSDTIALGSATSVVLSCSGDFAQSADAPRWFTAALTWVRVGKTTVISGTITAAGTAGIVGATIVGVAAVVAAAYVGTKVVQWAMSGKAEAAK